MVELYIDVHAKKPLDLGLNAIAVLWERKTKGQSVHRLQRSRTISPWYCPWAKVVSVDEVLGAPQPVDIVLSSLGGSEMNGSMVNVKEKCTTPPPPTAPTN